MASRKIEDLTPELQILCKEFVARCIHDGIDILITCTYRPPEEQDRLYAQGRTLPGAIVTNAKAGQSAHNKTDAKGRPAARAFDVVPLRNGKCIWGTSGADGHVWSRIGEHGMKLGLNWYGAPDSKFREMPHFELR
jgi:peptidoglycan LD-endopeptidase CwlK